MRLLGVAGLPGVRLSAAQAELDDYTRLGTVSVSAQLNGAASDMLGYVNRSPVAGFTGQALAQARFGGDADLSLNTTAIATAFAALTSTRVRAAIEQRGIALIRWADLA